MTDGATLACTEVLCCMEFDNGNKETLERKALHNLLRTKSIIQDRVEGYINCLLY